MFEICEVIKERWANWLQQDPVVAIKTQADNLRRLKALYIDCGENDQFNLLYGARRFVRRLKISALRIATRSSTTTIAVSITGWTRACRSWPRRLPADLQGYRRSLAALGVGGFSDTIGSS